MADDAWSDADAARVLDRFATDLLIVAATVTELRREHLADYERDFAHNENARRIADSARWCSGLLRTLAGDLRTRPEGST